MHAFPEQLAPVVVWHTPGFVQSAAVQHSPVRHAPLHKTVLGGHTMIGRGLKTVAPPTAMNKTAAPGTVVTGGV